MQDIFIWGLGIRAYKVGNAKGTLQFFLDQAL